MVREVGCGAGMGWGGDIRSCATRKASQAAYQMSMFVHPKRDGWERGEERLNTEIRGSSQRKAEKMKRILKNRIAMEGYSESEAGRLQACLWKRQCALLSRQPVG